MFPAIFTRTFMTITPAPEEGRECPNAGRWSPLLDIGWLGDGHKVCCPPVAAGLGYNRRGWPSLWPFTRADRQMAFPSLIMLLLLAAWPGWTHQQSFSTESVSRFVSRHRINQGVAACCPEPLADCCRRRLLRDQPVLCPGLDSEQALALGICLERHFHGGQSVMAERSHQCCWLLDGIACRRRCYADLRTPTMSADQKFAFTDHCPKSVLNASVDPAELDCILDRVQVLHSCFSTCLHYMNGTEARHDRFRPARDCEVYSQLMESDSCHVPLHIFHLAQNIAKAIRENGTAAEEEEGTA